MLPGVLSLLLSTGRDPLFLNSVILGLVCIPESSELLTKLRSHSKGGEWVLNDVYKQHPLRPLEFVPLSGNKKLCAVQHNKINIFSEDFHKCIRRDKKAEFKQFLWNLGAKSVVTKKSTLLSHYFSILICTVAQIANPKDKDFVAKQVKLKQGGVEYPQLAEDSIWYPTDENWQKFARDRQRPLKSEI